MAKFEIVSSYRDGGDWIVSEIKFFESRAESAIKFYQMVQSCIDSAESVHIKLIDKSGVPIYEAGVFFWIV